MNIAIPTYRRYDTVCDKTLAYLAWTDAWELPITLFVASEAEKEAYWIALRRRGWEEKVPIVVGRLGIGPQRNFIHDYYPEGSPVFSLDDDIDALYYRASPKIVAPFNPLKGLLDDAGAMMSKSGLRLWGVHPTDNPFYMDDSTTFDFRFICSCVYGFIADRDPRRRVVLNTKQDYERTCRYYLLDGGMVRFNWIGPKTRYYTERGGLETLRTPAEAKKNALWLVKTFPGLVEINPHRKGEWTEVRLNGNPGRAKDKAVRHSARKTEKV